MATAEPSRLRQLAGVCVRGGYDAGWGGWDAEDARTGSTEGVRSEHGWSEVDGDPSESESDFA